MSEPAGTVTGLGFSMLRVGERHSHPLCSSSLPLPSVPVQGSSAMVLLGGHHWETGLEHPRGEGPGSDAADGPQRGWRSQAGPFQAHPSPGRSEALQHCRLALGFPGAFFLLWAVFPPLSIVFCGGAGFLLSVSEVCSGAEKD